jgi:hypothetical protein
LAHTPEEDLSKNTLSRIGSTFGRLVYLVSLRDPDSGSYRHDGLSTIHGEAKAVRAIKRAHDATFAHWLSLSLARKKMDLDEYFAGSESREPRSLKGLTLIISAPSLIPSGCGLADRTLFLAEVKLLFEILAISENGRGDGSR